ncbi:hypothetical protein GYH30_015736 [Glycine max]|uniref:Uncharacterized protein n=2 Tax=Glycine subgen. Soja TaxID=1462606 RepID=K7KWA0_SOYBN|nr:hypothetical protein JHK87_015824 [Glycine soja]KAH1126891.1 hypothetical protein GYH30_015736 [Glycine max]RZC08506.1 Transcription initiation factor TFIID subunit 2 [Glycine soja]
MINFVAHVIFILLFFQYNDNNENPYSDLVSLSLGNSILLLSSLLKCIEWLLQFDSLMPSYNGILTISCIRTLTQIALKAFMVHSAYIKELCQVRIEACIALLDLEFQYKGMDSTLLLFIKYIEDFAFLKRL